MEEEIKTKKCVKCHDEKFLCDFGFDKKRKDGLKVYCKKCRKNESDSVKDKKRKKDWYLKNRELSIKRACQRQKEKRTERNDYLRKYYKNKPYIYTWRSLIYRTVTEKTNNTYELLGYTYDELKKHLESLFTEGMSWENYGEWHVDHIKPLISFNKDTHPSIVNALINLQPLWATTREINGVTYIGNLNKLNNYE